MAFIALFRVPNSEAIVGYDTDTGNVIIYKESDGLKTKLSNFSVGTGGTSLLSGPDAIEVTTASKTLPALLGVPLQKNLKKLTIIINGGTVFWATGTAVTGVNELTVTAIEMNILKAQAELLEFVVTSGTQKVTILQEG